MKEQNFINQILKFESISYRCIDYWHNIKLTGDIDRDIGELEHMIKDFDYYSNVVFKNALKRLNLLKDLGEKDKEWINDEYIDAVKFKGINM